MNKNVNNKEQNEGNEIKYANPFIRIIANIIDIILFSIPILLIIIATVGFENINNPEKINEMETFSYISNSLVVIATILFWTKFNGQTPGKKICKIRIVDDKSFSNINLTQSIFRFIGINISIVTLIGPFFMFFNKKRKGLHDYFASTVVIKVSSIKDKSEKKN